MTFLFLDPRSQLAILLAASVATATGGCGGRPPPAPGGDGGGIDAVVVDPLPPDAQSDYPIADPMPVDAQSDPLVADMLPDAQSDYPIADPMPEDAGVFECMVPDMQELDPPPPMRRLPDEDAVARERARAARADDLPLARSLTVKIRRVTVTGEQLRLRAAASYTSRHLSYTWTASAGTLSARSAREVVWTPPPGPGRHLIQVAVRDGDLALAVDAITVVR